MPALTPHGAPGGDVGVATVTPGVAGLGAVVDVGPDVAAEPGFEAGPHAVNVRAIAKTAAAAFGVLLMPPHPLALPMDVVARKCDPERRCLTRLHPSICRPPPKTASRVLV